jgi:hypothetical protein
MAVEMFRGPDHIAIRSVIGIPPYKHVKTVF